MNKKVLSLIAVLSAIAFLLAGCDGRPETAGDVIVRVPATALTTTPAAAIPTTSAPIIPTPVAPITPTVAPIIPTPVAPITPTVVPIIPTPVAPITPTVAVPVATQTPFIVIVTATPAMTPAAPTVTGTLPTCTLPADEAGMPAYLTAKFGGSANQWRRKIDQATGLSLCAWEFLSQNRELGVGPNAVLRYGSDANGTISYGVRNSTATAWMAAYLVGPGDYTVAQVGKSDPTAIDTATWIPDLAGPEQVKARTPGGTIAPSATPTITPVPASAPATRPTAGGATINQAQLETLTGGPARFWVWVTKGDKAHWEFQSGDTLVELKLKLDLPANTYISYGKEDPPASGKWVEARITQAGQTTGPLNKASFVTP